MVVSDSDQLGRVYPDNPTVFHRLEYWIALGFRFGTVSDELVVHSSSLQRATTVLMRAIVGNFYYECYLSLGVDVDMTLCNISP